MTTEFSKLRSGFLAQDDFKGGVLGFLVETHEGEEPVHEGVTIESQIGNNFKGHNNYCVP
jgi:hypothetical protein